MTDLAVAYDFERHVGAYPYDYDRGPEMVRTWEDARKGLNCVAMTHLLLSDLYGESLPPHLHAYEMFMDTEYFAAVGGLPEAQRGDLAWFGVAQPRTPLEAFRPEYDELGDLTNWHRFPVNHVGVLIGERHFGDPLVLHASPVEGTSVIWPISEFRRHSRYTAVYGLQRYVNALSRTSKDQAPEPAPV